MVDAAERAGVRHMTAFTYRFVPAMQLHAPPRHQRRDRHALALPGTALPGLGPARHRLAAAAVGGRHGRDWRHALASPRLRALPRRPDRARHGADASDLADAARRRRAGARLGHRGLGGLPGAVRARDDRRVREREDRHRLCRRHHQPRLLRGQRQRGRRRLRAVTAACVSASRARAATTRRSTCRPSSGRSPARLATPTPTRGRRSATTRTSSSSRPSTPAARASRRSSMACARSWSWRRSSARHASSERVDVARV